MEKPSEETTTLRDMYAGLAMMVFYNRCLEQGISFWQNNGAQQAFDHADMMIAERARRTNNGS